MCRLVLHFLRVLSFLCCQRIIAAHKDHYVWRLSVRPCVCLSGTVNVVIFAGGKFRISRGGNFRDTTPISFIEAYGFYCCLG